MAEEEYFWKLVELLCEGLPCHHVRLLRALHNVTFEMLHPLDENRISDARSLRRDLSNGDIPDYPTASVLEVLAGLSNRLETNVLWSEEIPRRGRFFWEMMINLHLTQVTDENYDYIGDTFVYATIDNFVKGDYNYDGSNGGAFIIPSPRAPLNQTELWYQANWYIAEKRRKGEEIHGLEEYIRREE